MGNRLVLIVFPDSSVSMGSPPPSVDILFYRLDLIGYNFYSPRKRYNYTCSINYVLSQTSDQEADSLLCA